MLVRVGSAIIALAACFHAGAILYANLPMSTLKQLTTPLFGWYVGPHVQQGWSMFAPAPPQENIHVVARGRAADGTLTAWLDVTQFFIDEVGANRFNPLRELGEGLAHSATPIAADPQTTSHAIVLRTCAIVLNLYSTRPLVREQVELRYLPIDRSKKPIYERWPWEPFANVPR